MIERRISKPGEFSGLAVFERSEPAGPVYSIVFSNLEYPQGWEMLPRAGAITAALMLAFMGSIPACMVVGERAGEGWGFGAFALCWLVFAFAWQWFFSPGHAPRRIEFDPASDRISVYRKNKAEVVQALSMLGPVTIEPHPDAEMERERRQVRGDKSVSKAEKQQCLVGWFGRGGTDPVTLIVRAEWPPQRSLLQLREAVLWVKELAQGPERRPEREGINPPLD